MHTGLIWKHQEMQDPVLSFRTLPQTKKKLKNKKNPTPNKTQNKTSYFSGKIFIQFRALVSD